MLSPSIKLAALAMVLVILLAACQRDSGAPPAQEPPEELVVEHVPVLYDFPGIDEFKSVFNRDADQPRVILLLSPT